jgi:hypothetical protein
VLYRTTTASTLERAARHRRRPGPVRIEIPQRGAIREGSGPTFVDRVTGFGSAVEIRDAIDERRCFTTPSSSSASTREGTEHGPATSSVRSRYLVLAVAIGASVAASLVLWPWAGHLGIAAALASLFAVLRGSANHGDPARETAVKLGYTR